MNRSLCPVCRTLIDVVAATYCDDVCRRIAEAAVALVTETALLDHIAFTNPDVECIGTIDERGDGGFTLQLFGCAIQEFPTLAHLLDEFDDADNDECADSTAFALAAGTDDPIRIVFLGQLRRANARTGA